jgi:hypothetical protein
MTTRILTGQERGDSVRLLRSARNDKEQVIARSRATKQSLPVTISVADN